MSHEDCVDLQLTHKTEVFEEGHLAVRTANLVGVEQVNCVLLHD
jgi:hypothetical protein